MGFVGKDPFFEKATKYNWENTGFTQDDDHPVVNVSWNDAQAFCRWLSTKEGKTYRLPTEEEWEYACRAGTTTTWYCGDSEKGLKEVANIADVAFKKKISGFKSHDWDDGFAFTSPVGKFRANDFRLYDMHGNVWQWCDDWYAAYNEKGAKKEHVVRGGSWGTDAAACRSARRDKNPPGYRFNDLGFRVVCVVQ